MAKRSKRRKNSAFTYGKIRRVVIRGDKFKVARALADAGIPFVFVKQYGVNTVGDIGKQHLAKLSKFMGQHPSFEGRFAAHKDQLAANKRKKNPVTLKNFGLMTAKQLNGLLGSFPPSVKIARGDLMITATTTGGNKLLSAARVGPRMFHVRAPAGMIETHTENPIKGPGKFKGETYAGRYAYLNVDDELGDVQDFGWYGNFSGKIKGRGPFHIIVREDSQGFVYGEFFDTEARMRKTWRRLEKEYADFEDEISEREGEE